MKRIKTFSQFCLNSKQLDKAISDEEQEHIVYKKHFKLQQLRRSNYLIKNGSKIKAIKINGGWLELDSMDDYELYENLKMKDETKKFFH